MNMPAVKSQQGGQVIPALHMNEDELISVLQSSVYPGAKLESIKLVIGACRASGKDPLKKPYHIVPMSVATGKKDAKGWDIKEMRDVIMPGINDYRTDASRTGEHIGTSEPEFGPEVTEVLDGVKITYPEWCRVTVRRLCSNGIEAEFTAKEFWKENYATTKRDSEAPNSMWKKRPKGQIAKCAEAQALRKGFPEVGNQPTADEMEGKEIDMGAADVVGSTPSDPPAAKAPQRKSEKQQPQDEQKKPAASATIDNDTGEIIEPPQQPKPEAASKPQQDNQGGPVASEGLLKVVRTKLTAAGLDEAIACAEFDLETLVGISAALANKIIKWSAENANV